MTGGKATSQGHSLGGMYPLNMHVPWLHAWYKCCRNHRQLRAGWVATPGSRSRAGLCAVKMHRIPGRVSQMCSRSPRALRSVTYPHRPAPRGASVMTSACFVPHFGREIKILLGKEKQTSKFCWPNWACGKAAKNKRENSKSTKNPSLERKRKGSGLTDTFPRMTNF